MLQSNFAPGPASSQFSVAVARPTIVGKTHHRRTRTGACRSWPKVETRDGLKPTLTDRSPLRKADVRLGPADAQPVKLERRCQAISVAYVGNEEITDTSAPQ